MRILNVFDAVRDGSFEDFKKFYDGNINQINDGLDIDLLSMAMTNDKKAEEKLKIIRFLLDENINVNFVDKKEKRNALHTFYFCVLRPSVEYELEVTKLLLNKGLNINATDKYNAIPLKYAITINKLLTEDNKELYNLLLEKGSNYELKDAFGKSCLDYAKEYSWRNGFLEIVKGFENGNK